MMRSTSARDASIAGSAPGASTAVAPPRATATTSAIIRCSPSIRTAAASVSGAAATVAAPPWLGCSMGPLLQYVSVVGCASRLVHTAFYVQDVNDSSGSLPIIQL